LNEANRITKKHLFTLQQGVSGHQLQEMKDNNVTLVVPASYSSSFPKEWRNSLLTLDKFIGYIRTEQNSMPELAKWIN
jgi:type II restriction enzyme